MTYLHYRFSMGSLKEIEDRCNRRQRQIDVQLDDLAKLQDNAQNVKEKIASLRRQRGNYAAQYDDVFEEIWWREQPETLIQDYRNRGYVLMYRCSNQEFTTEAEALSEANFQHTYNDVLMDYGADGDGIDDMIPAADMIQAFFRKGA